MDNFRHFIGIGGSGISALAYLAKKNGLTVTGSDESNNATIQKLKEKGIEVFNKHAENNIDKRCTSVVYTEAIDQKTNPEYLEAQKRGLPIKSYFEALGELSTNKKTIVIAGSHGKTTTTAMLGQALLESNQDPTVIVGSRVPYFDNMNIHIGEDTYLVAEGCEYRENFLSLSPFGVVILNCELEHVDYYESEALYLDAFKKLVEKIPNEGFLIFNQDDMNCQKISQFCKGRTIGVNMNEAKEIELSVPGKFNQLNALHALRVGEEINIDKALLLKGLKAFRGTARRMEIKGENKGVLVIDDYAHHPTEIKATLGALKETYPERRLICIFQPHQYSRTLELLNDFKSSFINADLTIIPNIYEARDKEEDKAKISAESLASGIPGGMWLDGKENTTNWLKINTRKDDLIVTMGAGDVYKIGNSFLA